MGTKSNLIRTRAISAATDGTTEARSPERARSLLESLRDMIMNEVPRGTTGLLRLSAA